MNFPIFEPIDLFVHELQVICPKDLSHKQVHFHICKTASNVTPNPHDRSKLDQWKPKHNSKVERRERGARVYLRKALTFFLGRPLDLLKMAG